MNRFKLVCAFLFIILGFAAVAQAEDVVYLKDGSIIHGTIIEEVPGVSIKIQTNDGNTFVYKMKAIDKITHSAADADSSVAPDNGQPTDNGDQVVVVKRRHGGRLVDDFKTDPNAGFSLFSFYAGIGVASMGTIDTLNSYITTYAGSSYDLSPLVYSGNFGLGWFTNHIGLKWTLTYGVNVSSYNYGYTYYNTTDFYIYEYGSELEADFSLDDVQTSKSRPNARRIFSAYIPVVAGYWDVNVLNQYTAYNYTATATDFGSGLGFRFFNDNHTMIDLQFLYRWGVGNALEYNNQANTRTVLPNGKYLDADVSGLSMNIDFGITF